MSRFDILVAHSYEFNHLLFSYDLLMSQLFGVQVHVFFFLLKMSYFLCFVKLMANLPNLIYLFSYDRHMSH